VVPFGETCDVCVIHTCTVTANAQRDCLRLARSAKRSNINTRVVLAGCAVEVDGTHLLKESGADMIAGQKAKFRLPLLLEKQKKRTVRVPADGILDSPPLFSSTRAFVKVQDGCNFRCTYCIVPSARGEPVSRPWSQVINDVTMLADNGFKEVVLTGANLGCYKSGRRTLTDILEKVEAVNGISRIRLSSIEVSTIEREIIDYMASSQKLCHSIHIPLQSGDDGILRSMGRKYTTDDYRALVDYAGSRIPLLGLGTDIMVGFPGESEKAFLNTLRMVKEIPFSNLHVFSYSKRPGTPAAVMRGQIDPKAKKRRSGILLDLGKKKKETFARQFIGRHVSLLVENVEGSTVSGWTSEYVRARTSVSKPEKNKLLTFIPSFYDADSLR